MPLTGLAFKCLPASPGSWLRGSGASRTLLIAKPRLGSHSRLYFAYHLRSLVITRCCLSSTPRNNLSAMSPRSGQPLLRRFRTQALVMARTRQPRQSRLTEFTPAIASDLAAACQVKSATSLIAAYGAMTRGRTANHHGGWTGHAESSDQSDGNAFRLRAIDI